jgi:hypothetical protein
MTWAMERRLDWIDDVLTHSGAINRGEIVTAFEVTLAIASLDLREFQKLDAHLGYDAVRKRYERRGGGSVRQSSAQRRDAWQHLGAPLPKRTTW